MLRERDILPSVEVKTCVLEHMERKSCSFYGICFGSPSVCDNIKLYEGVTGKQLLRTFHTAWRGFIPPLRKFLCFLPIASPPSGGFVLRVQRGKETDFFVAFLVRANKRKGQPVPFGSGSPFLLLVRGFHASLVLMSASFKALRASLLSVPLERRFSW